MRSNLEKDSGRKPVQSPPRVSLGAVLARIRSIVHSLSYVTGFLGTAFLLCAAIGVVYKDRPDAIRSFFVAGSACLVASFFAWVFTRHPAELKRRDAIILVLSAWVFSGLIGSIPYRALGICEDMASAIFESFSGLTTTGASVLSNLEALPRSILFWRSFTHFMGGVGILIMFIAILPFVGAGGVQLYKTESTGVFSERLTARIADTARIVMGVYLLLNLLCTLALRAGGLSWFDSICHAFGAIATGGFSTRSESIAAFQSSYVEWVIIFFMFVSGVSFIAHYRAIRGQWRHYARSSEIRLYTVLSVGAIACATILLLHRFDDGFSSTFRRAAFQTISLISTTGFTTADYDPWPNAIKVLFLSLMVIGACSGSTSGAIKSVRMVVFGKWIGAQLKRDLTPNAVISIRLDGVAIESDRASKAIYYIALYLTILGVASLLISTFTEDILTAVSAVIACLGGVGPGMSGAGPTETYAHFPALAKMLLVACMLLGRLEIYIFLAVFAPSFWKK